MKDYFNQKVIIVTGSSMGIGKCLAKLLGSYNARIVINGRNKEKLEETEKELQQAGFEVFACVADISQENDCRELIRNTIERFGRIDILVNNAAVSMRGRFEQLTTEMISRIYNVNTVGPVILTQLAIPHIKQTKGSIVFISSIAGFKGIPLISVYASSKMAITAIVEALRVEHRPDGVHFGIVHVGYTEIEAGKTVLDTNGLPVFLDPRKSLLVDRTETVAKKIAQHLYRRKNKTTIGFIGKFYEGIVRFFPRLINFSIFHLYKKAKDIYR